MKGLKLNKKSIIATGTSILAAGAGSAVADWLLAKYDIIPADYQQYTNIGKVIVGALAGSAVKNQIAKSAFDGIATVAAAKLVEEYLPEVEDTTKGANGVRFMGRIAGDRIHMGQRGYRVDTVGKVPFMG